MQDFVSLLLDDQLNKQETADLSERILALTKAARVPFEMELIVMGHGVVITIPEQYSVQEVIEIRRSFVELIKSDVPVFICRGGIQIQKLHADLVIAARRFIERCYACKGTGVVGEENETPMNCGVCADLRAAVSFFDQYNIVEYPSLVTVDPSKAPVFHKGERLLYVVDSTKPKNEEIASFISYVRGDVVIDQEGPHANETDEWQPFAKIALDGYVEPQIVSTEKLYPDPLLTVKYSTPIMKFEKGDPVLWHNRVKQRMDHAVFGWYIRGMGETAQPQPHAMVFVDEHPNIPVLVAAVDLTLWVHSSSSTPTDPDASEGS